jgi:uncharacterized protein YlzI (FlbEa/FlbD family)
MVTEITFDKYKEFGINVLTGEACALSMRLLCELQPETMEQYIGFLGLRVNIEQISKSEWNNRDSYAVFMTWEMIWQLMTFITASKNEYTVEILPNEEQCKISGVCGKKYLITGSKDEVKQRIEERKAIYTFYTWDDEHNQNIEHKGLFDIGRTYFTYGSQPHVGMSNVHAWTGMHQ